MFMKPRNSLRCFRDHRKKAIDKVKPDLASLSKGTLLRASRLVGEQVSTIFYCCTTANWISVYFQIGFSEFPSFLHCALCVHLIHPSHQLFGCDQSSTSHLHTIGRSWHSNSALLSLQLHKNQLRQGQGHPIENFPNVSNVVKDPAFAFKFRNSFSFVQKNKL